MAETVFITGAGRGLGLGLAARAASQGWRVIATQRTPSERLTALASLTGRVEILALDVASEASWAALAPRLEGRRVDLAVANAGVYIGRGGLDDADLTEETWTSTLMTNVFGAFMTARALRPALKRSQAGKLAVISSAMGSTARSPGGSYAYRASKAAATNLARNLAVELAEDGVAVGAYHPGWARTDMGGPSAEISEAQSVDGLWARFEALTLAKTGVFERYDGAEVPY